MKIPNLTFTALIALLAGLGSVIITGHAVQHHQAVPLKQLIITPFLLVVAIVALIIALVQAKRKATANPAPAAKN
jgi:hypothetical protein